MKEVGEEFRDKRESIGLKVCEVSKDLDITEAQLENLEDGNINAFKDIFFLKELLKKYAKYLGINENKVMDEFNESMFDLTSKIPVKELCEKIKEIEKEEKETKKIVSPYTKKEKITYKFNPIYLYVLIIVTFILLLLCLIFVIKNNLNNQDIAYLNYIGGESYEFTK